MTREERFEKARHERHSRILSAGVDLGLRVGLANMTRNEIARSATVAVGSINAAFGTMDALKRAVVTQAVDTRNLPLIAQAVALKTYDDLIPVDIRQEAACSLA